MKIGRGNRSTNFIHIGSVASDKKYAERARNTNYMSILWTSCKDHIIADFEMSISITYFVKLCAIIRSIPEHPLNSSDYCIQTLRRSKLKKERASEAQRMEFSARQMKFFVVRDKSRRVWRQGAFYASASPTQGFPLWGTDTTVFKEFRLLYKFTPYVHHKGPTVFVFIYRKFCYLLVWISGVQLMTSNILHLLCQYNR
jgi:hypothetical protein